MLSEILENDLKKSLFIEYYYGRKIVPSYFLTENKHMLCEEHGIMPHIDDYIDVFLDYMHKFDFSEKPKTIILSENIFSNIKNCFFKNILLSIDLCKTEKNNVNGYMNLSPNTEIEDGKVFRITGKFHIYCTEDKLDSSLATMLAHEITHVYENFKRVMSNAPSLYDVVANSNYSNNTDRYNSEYEYDRKLISHIVYYTTKFEVNAYAASIYGTLKAHAEELVDAHDAVDVIKYYSPVYQNFVTIGEYIQRLNMRWLDEQDTKLIEDAWYSSMGEKRKCGYIIKKLTSLYNKNWRKLKKVISKMCYDVYEKYGPSYTIDDNNLIG